MQARHKEKEMKAPNEIWLREDYLLQQLSSLWNAEQHENTDICYIQADKAHDLIKELVNKIGTLLTIAKTSIAVEQGFYQDHLIVKESLQLIAKAKKFLHE